MTDPAEPSIAGALTADGHVLHVRVYYEDTDFSGAVYHANYLRMMERGRSDFLRLIGISHRVLAADGLSFAVHRMNLAFHRAAAIDDVLMVGTRVQAVTGARVSLGQEVRRGGDLLVDAEVSIALIDRTGRPRRFPDAVSGPLRERLAAPG